MNVNFKNALPNALKRMAISQWQLYSYKKEWQSVIVLLLVLKLCTSAVSIFSGYFYLVNLFYGFLASPAAAKTFAVLSLFLIEGLTTLFLAKFFKFAIRLKLVTALMPFVCVAATFSLSFVVSCNGIALYMSESEDLSQVINAKFNEMAESAKTETAANVAEMQDYIETIKANPENWKNGQRCILSDKQNREIAAAYQSITNYKTDLKLTLNKIEAQRAAELRENSRVTTDTADHYYTIVAFIMFIQVACSAALSFFWSKISSQDAADMDYKEGVNDIREKADAFVDNVISLTLGNKMAQLTQSYASLKDELTKRETSATPYDIAASAPAMAKKTAGFQVPTAPEIAPENAQKTPETETPQDVSTFAVSDVNNAVNNAVKTPSVNGSHFCQFCGKPLTESQVFRRAKYCGNSCRVKAYNARNPERKPIIIDDAKLS